MLKSKLNFSLIIGDHLFVYMARKRSRSIKKLGVVGKVSLNYKVLFVHFFLLVFFFFNILVRFIVCRIDFVIVKEF